MNYVWNMFSESKLEIINCICLYSDASPFRSSPLFFFLFFFSPSFSLALNYWGKQKPRNCFVFISFHLFCKRKTFHTFMYFDEHRVWQVSYSMCNPKRAQCWASSKVFQICIVIDLIIVIKMCCGSFNNLHTEKKNNNKQQIFVPSNDG